MYGKIITNVFLSIMPPYDVTLMYCKILEVEETKSLKTSLKLIEKDTRKYNNNNFYYTKCIGMYGQCMEMILKLNFVR